MTHEVLHARARAVRSRALVRSFAYRQRNLAAGVWVELRMVLAMTRSAYVLSDEAAARLESEGVAPLAVGLRVQPNVRLYLVGSARLAMLEHGPEIPVRLDDRLIRSGAVALVSFGT